MREQRLLHPFGQDVMGVVHGYNQNESDICNYIQRISKYFLNLKMFNKLDFLN